MPDPFFFFFDRGRPEINPEDWPAWRDIEIKEYPRSEKTPLPKPMGGEPATLTDSIYKRKTQRDFNIKPIPAEKLSYLLYWSLALVHQDEKTEPLRRPYPSGGSRFPIEAYVALYGDGGLKPGAYHYNPKSHSLEAIAAGDPAMIRNSLSYDFAKKASTLIFLSLIAERTTVKYGNLGYKLGLIEAGHIGQNLYLMAGACGVKISALGGINHESIEKGLDLNDRRESIIYTLALDG